MPVHFVLDQNFPWLLVSLHWPPTIQISLLASLAPDLIHFISAELAKIRH